MTSELINILGVISLIVGALALILGLVQSWEAKKQTKRLKAHSDALGLITDSLSTRYIGQFPDYLVSVTNLIESAKSELNIIKGNPTPAYFSDPTLWVNYSQAIERKSHSGIAVNMICMTEHQRKDRLAQQFPTSKEKWDDWIKNNHSKVSHFLKFGYSKTKPEDLNFKVFLDLLLSTQTKMLNESFKSKGVEVLEIDQVMPVQVWIADRKQAVFSIQALPTNTISHGFYTSDPRIVSALHLMTELFTNKQINDMNIHSRIDTIIVTKDLNKSISLYRDEIGLEMRLLSNPVAIFKYDYISIYVYLDSFFREQFGIASEEVIGNGMLSIEINSKDYFNTLKSKLNTKSESYNVLSQSEFKIAIRDFNNLVTEFWVNNND